MSRLTVDRLLPVFLVGALLLCHGALGSLHQFHGAPESGLLAAEHAQHHGGQDTSDCYPAGANHVAAFFALLFGLVYGLLRREAGVRVLPLAARVVVVPVLAKVPILPRGPTFPLLQVFRL